MKLREVLRPKDFILLRRSYWEEVKTESERPVSTRFLSLWRELESDLRLLPLAAKSTSQLSQDLLVAFLTSFKERGFFVEIGGFDGVKHSNSYLLETELGWEGLIAEPGRRWQESLKSERRCKLDFRAVTGTSGQRLKFVERMELSSLGKRKLGFDLWNRTYAVETVSLSNLLNEHRVPAVFDYLSIDTEGSELEIVSAFPFVEHRPAIITIEHNFRPDRPKILELLTRKGYKLILRNHSHFDYWFVDEELLRQVNP